MAHHAEKRGKEAILIAADEVFNRGEVAPLELAEGLLILLARRRSALRQRGGNQMPAGSPLGPFVSLDAWGKEKFLGAKKKLLVGRIDQMLQALGELRSESRGPGVVDEADVEHVAEMRAIFVAEGCQFHTHKRLKGKDFELVLLFEFRHIGCGRIVFWPHLFLRNHHMNGIPRFGVGAIQENVDPRDMTPNKAHSLQCLCGGIKIGATKKNIHILRVSHRSGVDRRHPRRHRIATRHGVKNPRCVQSSRRSHQSIAHPFHGQHHPIQNGQL
jgi:hypothetical protein